MAYSEELNPFDDVVKQFAQSKGIDLADQGHDMGAVTETLRKQLAERYYREVFLPRLEIWNAFNSHLKTQEPTWTNPLILNPSFKRYHKERCYTQSLEVAEWQFENFSPNQQVKTEMSVLGLHVQDDDDAYVEKDLAKELPRTSLGSFVLGRNKTIRESYLAERIQNINAYTITAKIVNLSASDETKTIYFAGQEADTFVTIEQLKEAQRIYTTAQKDDGGVGFRTRLARFNGTFSAPIELPIELSDRFIWKRKSDGGVDIDGTFTNHSYLFEQKPCSSYYGEVDVTNGSNLFEHRGNEALAYLQAQALSTYMQTSTLIQPSVE